MSRVRTRRHWSPSIRARPCMRSSFIAAAVLARAMKFTRTPLHRRTTGCVTF